MKLNRRTLILSFVLLSLLISFSMNRIMAQVQTDDNQRIPVADIQKFATVIAQVKQYYIEPVTDKTLFNNAIRGMLSNLDPHSAYLDVNDLRDLQTVTTGEFGGIGIEVMPENGFIKVISPLDDTPASKAGIKPGDLIVRIGNKLVKDVTTEEAINMIRGPQGSKLTLTILRKGESKPLVLNLTREVVKVQSIKSRLLENGYGYIRLAFFQASTGADLKSAVDKMEAESGGHLKGLVLDLRNDPGGLLDSAVDVVNDFLDSNKLTKYNKLIVYTKGRIPGQDIQFKAHGDDLLQGTPMIVLINSGSASASEIVAGALQDYKRAIIMGTKSFGKGSVQTVIPIDKDSAIKLTTALYYTPSGRSIQAKGIRPDVVVSEFKIPKATDQDTSMIPLEEADLENHLNNGNAKPAPAPAPNAKPNALPNAQTQTETGDSEKLTLEENKKVESALAHDDFQLYEALNLLKGLYAAKVVE